MIMRNWGSKKKIDCINKPVSKRGRGYGSNLIKRVPILIIVLAFLFNVIIPTDYLA